MKMDQIVARLAELNAAGEAAEYEDEQDEIFEEYRELLPKAVAYYGPIIAKLIAARILHVQVEPEHFREIINFESAAFDVVDCYDNGALFLTLGDVTWGSPHNTPGRSGKN